MIDLVYLLNGSDTFSATKVNIYNLRFPFTSLKRFQFFFSQFVLKKHTFVFDLIKNYNLNLNGFKPI